MKKLFPVIILVTLLLAALTPNLFAAAAGDSVCIQSTKYIPPTLPGSRPVVGVYTFSCTGDSTDGSFLAMPFTTSLIQKFMGFYLYKVITNPGATSPTDNWDFTITDANSIDILGGSGANRHTTTSQMTAPLLTTGVYFAQPVLGPWTLNITGNSVNSATLVIDLVFVK